MKKPYYTSNYSDAWRKFRQSAEYRNALEALKPAGIKPRYLNNILRTVFDAGWGDKPIFQTSKG